MFKSIMFKRVLSITLITALACALCLTIPILKDSITNSSKNSVYAAGPTLNWIKNYGGSSVDQFNAVIQASDGGYVAVGYSYSANGDVPPDTSILFGYKFVIAKFDKNGNKQWLKTYGGSGFDYFYSVTQAPGGGYVAVGYSSSSNGDLPPDTITKTGTKFVIAKFDEYGNKKWIKAYGGTGSDYFQSVTQANGGGYVAAGYTTSSNGDVPPDTSTRSGTKFIIGKFDKNGNKQWMNAYGGSNIDYFRSIVQAPGGGYVAVGYSSSSNGDVPPDTSTRTGLKFIIAKVDNNGKKQWMKAYGGSSVDYFNSVTQAQGGGYVAVGDSYSTNGDLPGNKGNADAVIAKFDKNGNKMWIKNIGGSSYDSFSTVTQAAGNCIVAAGYSASLNGDIPGNKGSYDIIIAKFDRNGNKIWLNNYGGNNTEYCNSITQASGGGHIGAGNSMSTNGDLPGNKGNDDFILCKITERFTITLNTNGGKNIFPIEKTVISGGKYGKLPSPKRKGYTFKGWYTEKKNGKKITKNSVVAIRKDTMLYANWKGKKYTIRFCDQKGKQLYKKGKKLTKKVTYGRKYGVLEKPRDQAKQYRFLGWYTKKDGGKKITPESTVKITKTTKLYTRWKKTT